MMGLAKIILEATLFAVLIGSTTASNVDLNTLLSPSIVNIPAETNELAELPKNIDTSHIFNPNGPQRNESLKIQYIPVGNGEAILITVNGYTVLLDGGENIHERKFLAYLRNAHITKIDYLIITNPVDENIGLLDGVIKNLEVDKIYSPKLTRDSADYKNLLIEMNSKNKSFLQAEKYNKFNVGDASITFLHVDNTDPEDINSASIVLNLTYKDKNFLFASNINKTTEQSIAWPKAEVLKVASKGKSIANEYIFFAKVKPSISVIIKDSDGTDQKVEENIKKLNSKIIYADTNNIVQITYDGTAVKHQLVQNTII